MKRPTVSIVIPAYNAADTLGTALCSALRQSYSPIEVVVVDDGSTDGTGDVAARIAPEAKVICQQNQGLPAARNVGWRAASGEFICFLDADDGCHPQRIETQLGVLEANPDVACVLTGRAQIGPQGVRVRPIDKCGRIARHSAEDILRYCRRGSGASMLMRREVLESTSGFDEPASKKTSGEEELLARITLLGSVVTVWSPLYWVYQSPGSLRWQYSAESFAENHFRWLDRWVQGDPQTVSANISAPRVRRAARAGLLRRCLWRTWVMRDPSCIDAGLRAMRQWGALSVGERVTAAIAKAGIATARLLGSGPPPH